LAVNTIWNLRSFNRDSNHLIRQQAVNIAETIEPTILDNLEDPENLTLIINTIESSNTDIVSTTVLEVQGNSMKVISTTDEKVDLEDPVNLPLNQLAVGFDQSFAGLTYDPELGSKVWNVVVPIGPEKEKDHVLSLTLRTEAVERILQRTSRDSIIILVITIIITLVLLANHLIFYKKNLEAQQLEELDRLKDEFISTAAHELRSPITALSGRLALLHQKIPDTAKTVVNTELEVIDRNSKSILELINDLLDVSRIQQGRLKINKQDTQVNDVIEKVLELISPLADKKGLELKFEKIDLPIVQTDPERLRQVITNLLSNSVKYTLEGNVELKAEVKSKTILFTINDTGVGIPPEHLPKLFSKFHRVKDSKTEGTTGTGLGLWITKQIVEMLGGEIFAESIYGTGTRFTFTIPLT
jgi:signal transduction histidine kinase